MVMVTVTVIVKKEKDKNKDLMRINIEKIAKIAGVSKTTVSRVINKKPDVKPSTREKILKIISEYGFHPNIFAKGISSKRIKHIGLIIPYTIEYILSNQFYVDVMHGISNEVERSGYYLLICLYNVYETNYVKIYMQKRVDGFIVMSPSFLHRKIIHELYEANVPFVSTAKLLGKEKITYVDVDNFKGARLAVEHLISLGHKKIAFIGKPALTSSSDRLAGYKETLAKYNLPIRNEFIKVSEAPSMVCGHDVMFELLNYKDIPTAVFLSNDMMAIGAIKAVKEIGKKIPDDISIVGFDDIALSRFTSPALTTVHQPAYEKGFEATKSLIRFLEEGVKPITKILNVNLVVRNSTGPVKKSK